MSLVVRGPVTPASAGWTYVGFEVATGAFERSTGDDEHCLVVVSGSCTVRSEHGDWELGGRPDPFSGRPDAAETQYGSSSSGSIVGSAWISIPPWRSATSLARVRSSRSS